MKKIHLLMSTIWLWYWTLKYRSFTIFRGENSLRLVCMYWPSSVGWKRTAGENLLLHHSLLEKRLITVVLGYTLFFILSEFCHFFCMISINPSSLLANSADDKFLVFFLHSPENQIWHFMQIVSKGQFVWNDKSCFQGIIRNLFQNVIGIFYPEC